MTTPQPRPRTPTIALPPVGMKCKVCGGPAIRIVSDGRYLCQPHADASGLNVLLVGEQPYDQRPQQGEKASPTPAPPPADQAELYDFDPPPVTGDKLDRIKGLGQQQLQLKANIESVNQILERLNNRLKANVEADLPEAMTAAGMEQFTLDTGEEFVLKDWVAASIPKHLREPAMGWLEKNKGGHLIKRTVTIFLGKDDAWRLLLKQVEAFLKKINKTRKYKAEHRLEMAVAWNSLTAWVKERDEEKIPVDEKLLGVFRKRIAVQQESEEKKAKDTSIPMGDDHQ